MIDLSVNVAGVTFKNPIIAASGTFGFGREYSSLFPLSDLGGVSLKGTTLKERPGNPPSRIAETPAGMLNSVGLQNPGIDHLLKDDLPWLSEQDTVLIANIAGEEISDYVAVAEKINDTAIHMVEMNISCPNVKKGGITMGTLPENVAAVTKAVRAVCKKPLTVKLSPNVTDIVSIAKAAESEGADALSLINTLTGMRIDINTRRPILRNNIGGLSGPAVFPVALRMVYQVSRAVGIPVIGMGGVTTWEDAVEMLMAGASALQIGTALFTDAYAPQKILEGLTQYCEQKNIARVAELTGTVEPW